MDAAPLRLAEVLRQEQQALRAGQTSALSALCLSGGGIRSATFGLGVIQGLAQRGWLPHFDYLSTVSGGGYVGGWLAAWCSRAGAQPRAAAAAAAASGTRGAAALGPAPTIDPVGHWRDYSNYLSPRVGAASLDTWTLAVTVVGNIVLNWLVFLPALLALLLLPRVLLVFTLSPVPAWIVAVLGGLALLLAVLGFAAVRRDLPRAGGANPAPCEVIGWGLAPLAAAAVLGCVGLRMAARAPGWVRALRPQLWLTLAPALLLVGVALMGTLAAALASPGRRRPLREWAARAAAVLAMAAFAWLLLVGVVLLAPAWLLPLGRWALAGFAGVAGLAGWLGALAGFRSAADAVTAAVGARARLLPIALAAFLLLLAALAAAALARLPGPPLAWFAAFAAFACALGRCLDVNQISLAGMYRDRLVRAYLGASNPNPEVNRFTEFSSSDDVPLHSLRGVRPMPVLNLTLNLTQGERLAWQQRQAEPFTATPWACGSARLGYRDAAAYAGSGGLSLGTAMSLSGAALSPNMGYHSSPLAAFVMALFNLRLGAWLGNPGAAGAHAWRRPGPRSSLGWLWREALGWTNDRSDFVYLSDGGHFENLGLYEMVRRRCRTIVVVDAGCDPQLALEDLGNALRKIRLDLRVAVDFDEPDLERLRARSQRWALATVSYGQADGATAAGGRLLYLKPLLSLDHNESPDVASYAAAHPSFPHQSTADQWFDESQTESYRQLGFETLTAAAADPRVAIFFRRLAACQ